LHFASDVDKVSNGAWEA